MVIGLIAAAGAGIPAQFIPASLSATASPQLVRLGSGHFYRLLALSSAHEALYASAGTSPELVAACQSASAAFAGDCERVLATLALTPTPAPAPAPIADPAYARQLSAALAELNRSRTSLSRTLALAQTAAAQARAAASLAAVHLVAANAIARLKGGSATAANRELVRALRGAAIAYARLAQAATRGNGTAYAAAEPAVGGANASIADALSQLRTLGYTVT
jgi:SWI/SNF-related matrix-associated actin-dependent regulator 1 of chromatin subfamily A